VKATVPPSPAPLPMLGKRRHVRVLIAPAVRVYATVRASGAVLGAARGVVSDISAGGMAVNLIEGGRFELPPPGSDAQVEIDFEGEEVKVTGTVVRTSAQELSFAFPPAHTDQDLDVELLGLIASIVTRRVELVDRRVAAARLASKLTHRHFYGAGYLDLRVQTEEPAWWQLVFLENLVSWNRRDGAGQVSTGHIDRSFSAENANDAIAVSPNVTRHAQPWPKLRKLAARIATKCAATLPAHADAFELIKQTVA
jgi:hypothetical protein